MSDSMIDRVTLAICNSIRLEHDLPTLRDLSGVEGVVAYRRQARAAIASMYQSTEAMAVAGMRRVTPADERCICEPTMIWTAMVDAALK